MKHYKNAFLVLLLFLPFVTIQIYNNKYTAVENNICKQDKAFADACGYPERLERYRTLSTNFYRYLGDHFGRSMGTSPPFTYTLRYSVPEINEFSSQSEKNKSYEISAKEDEAENELGQFNLSLLVSFTFSVVVASAAATILLQKICKSNWKPSKPATD